MFYQYLRLLPIFLECKGRALEWLESWSWTQKCFLSEDITDDESRIRSPLGTYDATQVDFLLGKSCHIGEVIVLHIVIQRTSTLHERFYLVPPLFYVSRKRKWLQFSIFAELHSISESVCRVQMELDSARSRTISRDSTSKRSKIKRVVYCDILLVPVDGGYEPKRARSESSFVWSDTMIAHVLIERVECIWHAFCYSLHILCRIQSRKTSKRGDSYDRDNCHDDEELCECKSSASTRKKRKSIQRWFHAQMVRKTNCSLF